MTFGPLTCQALVDRHDVNEPTATSDLGIGSQARAVENSECRASLSSRIRGQLGKRAQVLGRFGYQHLYRESAIQNDIGDLM